MQEPSVTGSHINRKFDEWITGESIRREMRFLWIDDSNNLCNSFSPLCILALYRLRFSLAPEILRFRTSRSSGCVFIHQQHWIGLVGLLPSDPHLAVKRVGMHLGKCQRRLKSSCGEGHDQIKTPQSLL